MENNFKLAELQYLKREIGIYCLKDNGRIVYIGQSKNVYCRCLEHIIEGVKTFDSMRAMYLDDSVEVQIMEAIIIGLYTPKYNKLIVDPYTYYSSLPYEIKSNLSKKNYKEVEKLANIIYSTIEEPLDEHA